MYLFEYLAMLNKLWDLIFPPYCVACNAPGEWFCASCRDKIQRVRGGICAKCLSIGEHECKGELPFLSVMAFGYYHDPILRALITKLKFNGVTVLENDLKVFLSTRRSIELSPDAVIVPMPLAKKRLKERGFNQAEFTANVFKEAFALPNSMDLNVLQRMEHKDPQSSLAHDYGVRAGHIRGVFSAGKELPEHIVLVDDVVTTGATAGEAAKILLEAGAKRVDLIALAIGA